MTDVSTVETIAHRLRPLTARIRGKLLGKASVETRATEIVERAPALARWQPAAIALPDEFDRVTAVQEETTLEEEMSRLRAGTRQHGATVAYRLDNALVGCGTVYFDGGYHIIDKRATYRTLPRAIEHYAQAQICTNPVVERYFGHWVRNGSLLELLAEQRSMPALTHTGKPWPHEPGYRALLELPANPVVHARINQLWMIDDRGINDGWIARFEELRKRARRMAKTDGPKRVMLRRGKLGVPREMINRPNVIDALVARGFEIMDPEALSVVEITEKLAHAEIAVFVEGSVQSHCLLAMPGGSALLAIQPSNRFNSHAKIYADALGMHWGYVVAEAEGSSFRLPIDRLLHTLDLMEAARTTNR